LTIKNAGTASYDYAITEVGGRRATVKTTSSLVFKPDADRNARNTKGLFASDAQPQGWSPSATGDVLQSFTPQGMSNLWGVGYTGNVWLSDPWNRLNFEYLPEGTPTSRQWAANWSQNWVADMAYDPTRNLVCQVSVDWDGGIYCWDPDTGTVVDSLTGYFPWTQYSARGLAYRSDDDTFYVGGWNDGTIYHIKGLSATDRGTVISSCRPPDGEISGLAYNDSAGVLWEATNSWNDTIYELNPDDCTVLSTLAHPRPGYNGGGLEMDEEGNLWMVSQYPPTAYLVESGVPAFADVPWISESTTNGTLEPGQSTAIKVTVDTTGMTEGVYLASIFIRTTAAKEPYLRIPVSLIVSAYQQGVNAGGKTYTDALSDPWTEDQQYTMGSWGYRQTSFTQTTNSTIGGTQDQGLYQSQRIDPYAYRFDNIPNGVYQVEMKFAELCYVGFGRRIADVSIEDTKVLSQHDIRYDEELLYADDHTFFVEVVDNQLDVRLAKIDGYDPPVINALRVTHRPDR
jgi:hypothetical protein